MIYKKLTVALISIIWCLDSYAQQSQLMLYSLNPPNAARTSHAQYLYRIDDLYTPNEYEVEGTPYLNKSFLKSNVFSLKGNFFDVEMRYNIYYERMEFKEKDQLYALDPNVLIHKIVLGNDTFVVDGYEHKGEWKPMFLVRLDSGRIKLMSELRVIYHGPQQGKPIEGNVPAKYQRMPDINYVKIDNGPLKKVRSVKKLINQLPAHKKEMETFAKKEKISANRPEELKKLIQYYNSLE